MHYYSLREFIQKLESAGELARIREPVSPVLEITEFADRMSKRPGGGLALLFENVAGSRMPVLINAFGSLRRICLALGVDDLDDIGRGIERFLKIAPPATLLDKIKLLPMLLEAAQFPPRRLPPGAKAPCQEVAHTGAAVDLGLLPILQCWPGDAGRFITFPMVINRDCDGRIRNVGLYRMQVFDKNTTAMHWHIHKDGAHFFHEFKRRNQRMEVAVAIGGDPASCYAASAPLPYGVDEFLLAGFLRRAPVPLARCLTVDLEVPATAEIVIEGYIDPAEARLEGPFGDHTGYYSQDGDYPVLHVTAITHRRNPVYLTTIVGVPPQEDYYLGKATERIFLPLLRLQLPEIADMNMPAEGVFHNCVIVSIDKRYPMQARRLMNAFWGMGQMSFVKTIVTVDAGVNVHDPLAVLELLLCRFDPRRDLFFSEGVLDALNHSSARALYGSKAGVDLTTKLPEEGENAPLRAAASVLDPELPRRAQAKYGAIKNCRWLDVPGQLTVLLAAVEKTGPHQSARLTGDFLRDDEFAAVSILIVCEAHVDLADRSMVAWKFFANLDPRRDFYLEGERIGIDVTRKFAAEGYTQRWPEEIIMTPEIKALVQKKWEKLAL